ncbi:MAG TPA: HPF/RaiA family ribosome-associated protein [Candidatus Sulfotelmatobacter sp.]|nr:HPF/RaiA family ribosome-associated protein [Candidatus Sulfotelmatobacter sp.]
MRTIVRGRNFEVPEADRKYVEGKLHRLDRLLGERAEAIAELRVERHRSAATSHVVAVKLDLDGRPPIHGSARASTHRAAADEIIDLLERRAVDQKERLRQPDNPGAPSARSTVKAEPEAAADGSPRVVKVKRFALEPMFEEDAVTRMEELGHSFFVFVNAEDERLNVLYRRRDGDYGLIEPVVGGEYAVGRVRRRA